MLFVLLALGCRGPSWAEKEATDDRTYDPTIPSTAPAADDRGTPAGTLGPPTQEPVPSIGSSSMTREGSAGPSFAPYLPTEPKEGGTPPMKYHFDSPRPMSGAKLDVHERGDPDATQQ